MPFQRLLKPPQSTAARSMPTPQQSPLQRLQRGNLLLHKIVTACKSTRSPGMGAALFYVSISIVQRAMQAVPFQRLPEPPQSTAAHSMPTPQQSPLQRLQRGNLPLRKTPPELSSHSRWHTGYNTRNPAKSGTVFSSGKLSSAASESNR